MLLGSILAVSSDSKEVVRVTSLQMVPGIFTSYTEKLINTRTRVIFHQQCYKSPNCHEIRAVMNLCQAFSKHQLNPEYDQRTSQIEKAKHTYH